MRYLKYRNLKDVLETIKKWKKVGNSDFRNSINVFIELDSSFENVKNKFQIEGNILELDYVITKKFISYGSTSSIYDVDYKSLLSIAKKNGYQIIRDISINDFNNYIFICELLKENNINFIPLDYEILVKASEEVEIEISDTITVYSKSIE